MSSVESFFCCFVFVSKQTIKENEQRNRREYRCGFCFERQLFFFGREGLLTLFWIAEETNIIRVIECCSRAKKSTFLYRNFCSFPKISLKNREEKWYNKDKKRKRDRKAPFINFFPSPATAKNGRHAQKGGKNEQI